MGLFTHRKKSVSSGWGQRESKPENGETSKANLLFMILAVGPPFYLSGLCPHFPSGGENIPELLLSRLIQPKELLAGTLLGGDYRTLSQFHSASRFL